MEVAVYDESFAAFQAAADALQGEGKPILKFIKGRWVLGQDEEILPANSVIAANIAESEWGWIFWHDGKPEERRMTRIATGQRPAMRADLGHADQALWALDKNGKPIDPWAKTFEIPARELGGDMREVTIAGGSRGFEGAFKRLLSQFGQEMRLNAGKIPLVVLGADTYKHPEYGITDVPVISIKEWIDPEAAEDVEPEPAEVAEPSKKRARF